MEANSNKQASWFRFSILNLLLMTAVVALSIGVWQAEQRLVLLEEQILKLRREAGVVDVPNPEKLYVRKLKDKINSHPYLWRAYVPTGEWAYARLRVRDLNKPNSQGRMAVIGLAPGESSFAFLIRNGMYDLRRTTQYGGSESGIQSNGASCELKLVSPEELSDLSQGVSVGESITLLKGIAEAENGELIEVTIDLESSDRQPAKKK